MKKQKSITVTQSGSPKLCNASKRERKIFYIQLLTELLAMRKQQLEQQEE